MRYGGVAVATALVLGAVPAYAAPGDGAAAAAEVTVTLHGAAPVRVGPLARASTAGETDADIAGVNASGLVTAGMATSSAIREEDTGDIHARADIADVGIRLPELAGGLGAAHASCDTAEGGGTGLTTLGNARIAGLLLGASPAPNTVIDLAAARIVLNEQTRQPDGSLTVDAVHIYLKARVGSGDVVLAQATCGLAAHPVPLATGAGLWLGLGLLALAAIPVAVILRRRTGQHLVLDPSTDGASR